MWTLLPGFRGVCLFPFHLTHQSFSLTTILYISSQFIRFLLVVLSWARQDSWWAISELPTLLSENYLAISWDPWVHPQSYASLMVPFLFDHTFFFSLLLKSPTWEIIWNNFMRKFSILEVSLTCQFVSRTLCILSSRPIISVWILFS